MSVIGLKLGICSYLSFQLLYTEQNVKWKNMRIICFFGAVWMFTFCQCGMIFYSKHILAYLLSPKAFYCNFVKKDQSSLSLSPLKKRLQTFKSTKFLDFRGLFLSLQIITNSFLTIRTFMHRRQKLIDAVWFANVKTTSFWQFSNIRHFIQGTTEPGFPNNWFRFVNSFSISATVYCPSLKTLTVSK